MGENKKGESKRKEQNWEKVVYIRGRISPSASQTTLPTCWIRNLFLLVFLYN